MNCQEKHWISSLGEGEEEECLDFLNEKIVSAISMTPIIKF